MNIEQNENSRSSKLKSKMRAVAIGIMIALAISPVMTYLLMVYNYGSRGAEAFWRMLHVFFVAALIAIMATLPELQASAAGLNGANDTNTYAAVFVVPSTGALSEDMTAYTVSFCLTNNSAGTSLVMSGPVREKAGVTYDLNALCNDLKKYGLDISPTSYYPGYVSYGINGSNTLNIPNISYNPASGVIITNGGPSCTIACLRSTNMITWTAIFTNTIPAGFSWSVLDDNPPPSTALYYRSAVLGTNMALNAAMLGINPPAVAQCMVFVVVIIVGLIVTYKLYCVCKEYLPPLTNSPSSGSNNFVLPPIPMPMMAH